MTHGPLKKSTQINTKQHVGFLLYQCDGCTCFCAISSAMFGSVLDNATLIVNCIQPVSSCWLDGK